MYLGNYHHGSGKDAHEPDLDEVVKRAKLAGVTGMLITGTNLEDSRVAVELARRFHNPTTDMTALCTVGCHPTRCSEFESFRAGPAAYYEGLQQLVEEHHHQRPAGGGVVAAIGECGLDYDRLHFCPADVQKVYFEKQFALAEQFHLPMFLHNRNTQGDFVEMVRRNRDRFPGGVVHSFTDSTEELRALLDLDLYIGVNGCSLKTTENLETVKKIPLDRLLLETDAPYCEIKNTHASKQLWTQQGSGSSVSETVLKQFPSVKKEKFTKGAMVKGRNEPCTMIEILEAVYWIRRDEVENMNELAQIVEANTKRLFTL